MLIKNGNVIIFENDDVKVKKLDIRINGDTIEEIEEKYGLDIASIVNNIKENLKLNKIRNINDRKYIKAKF